jgi:hypothetical protein
MPRRNPKEQRSHLARPRRMTPKRHRRYAPASHADHQRALARGRKLTGVHRVARNQLKPWVVVLARIAYAEDANSSKVRPAVVLAVDGRDVSVVPLYTHRGNPNRAAAVVTPGADRGLEKVSEVRSGPVVVDIVDIVEVRGRIDPDDPDVGNVVALLGPLSGGRDAMVGSPALVACPAVVLAGGDACRAASGDAGCTPPRTQPCLTW